MARDTVMKKPKDTRGALRRILRYLGPWRYVILGVIALSLISNLLNLGRKELAKNIGQVELIKESARTVIETGDGAEVEKDIYYFFAMLE